jgi:catechol 2,3-dioxygenase-like lactoylglutathione lyase family enzyme
MFALELPMIRLVATLILCVLAGCASKQATASGRTPAKGDAPARTRLGNFSVSLAVTDLTASRAFYEKLGFRVIAGDQAEKWLILQNQSSTIGLFQGMFDRNILTFNPGWDGSGQPLSSFDDVREIQRELVAQGLALTTTADESATGPASLSLLDPDGNLILIDQHVPRPHP